MLTRGRLGGTSLAIESIEPISRDELGLLEENRTDTTPSGKGIIQRLRDPHHNLARLLASGMKQSEAARKAGYSISRVSLLMNSPSFKELLAHYRGLVTESFREEVDEYMELATSNMIKAERMIADKLEAAEEEDETLPTRDLIAISRDAADRFGYGKKQTNVNVNVDFAARLERAIARSGLNLQGSAKGNEPRLINAAPLRSNATLIETTSVPEAKVRRA